LIILNIIEELMCKTQEEFLEHFARLGVFSKVQALMDHSEDGGSQLLTASSQDLSASSQRCSVLCMPHRSASGKSITTL